MAEEPSRRVRSFLAMLLALGGLLCISMVPEYFPTYILFRYGGFWKDSLQGLYVILFGGALLILAREVKG